MAVFIRSHCLFVVSGQSLQSTDLLRSLSSSSTSSSERSASAYLRRNEQFAREIPIFKSVPAQLRSLVGGRAAPGDGAQENVIESGEEILDEGDRGQWDVTSNCVTPFFRVSPLASYDSDANRNKVHILFLSEGNVCRSVYAEAIFNALLRRHSLQDAVSCSSKATRDYNVEESADPRAVLVAEEHGLELPEGKVATVFDCSTDIVVSDLVLVMDKFTASDALKEVTVYEIINKQGQYSTKVRRLGEFCQTQQLEDIDDPLYGNIGGEKETELVRQVYIQVRDSCEGLMDYVLDIKANLEGGFLRSTYEKLAPLEKDFVQIHLSRGHSNTKCHESESESLKDGIARGLGRMDALNWLAPPMLSKV